MEKRLGKIDYIKFGHCGYNDVCLGLKIALKGEGWGVMTDKCFWDYNLVEHTEHCGWSEKDRDSNAVDLCMFISELLMQAKKKDIAELKNIPVEAEFDGNLLKSWRILEEVL